MDYLKYVHVTSKTVGRNKKLKRHYFLNTFNQFNPAYPGTHLYKPLRG